MNKDSDRSQATKMFRHQQLGWTTAKVLLKWKPISIMSKCQWEWPLPTSQETVRQWRLSEMQISSSFTTFVYYVLLPWPFQLQSTIKNYRVLFEYMNRKTTSKVKLFSQARGQLGPVHTKCLPVKGLHTPLAVFAPLTKSESQIKFLLCQGSKHCERRVPGVGTWNFIPRVSSLHST